MQGFRRQTLLKEVNSLSLSFSVLRGSCREHARQPAVSSWLGFSSPGPLWLHHIRDHKRGLERGGPAQWLRCGARFILLLQALFFHSGYCLGFVYTTASDVCLHAYLDLFTIVGVGTPGVVALYSIPKMCACICHHICVHLLVFQGRSARASKRQLRVSLEGPPGVFAPVVEQWGGKRKDSSCPQSAYMVSVPYLSRLNTKLWDQYHQLIVVLLFWCKFFKKNIY